MNMARIERRLTPQYIGIILTVVAVALSRSRLQTIPDNLPMAAWLKDREWRLLMVNNRYASGAGRPRSEILGLTDFDLWPPDQAEAYHAMDLDILSSGGGVKTHFQSLSPHCPSRDTMSPPGQLPLHGFL